MEIKAKNVECLKILISVAQTDGNYLGDAWYDVSIDEERGERSIRSAINSGFEMYQSIGISAIIWCECQ